MILKITKTDKSQNILVTCNSDNFFASSEKKAS